MNLCACFLERAAEDARVGPQHISLYITLLVLWRKRENENSFFLFSREVTPLCKISSATYHRCIQDLHELGYIRYQPSYNRFHGSKIDIVQLLEY